MEKQVVAIMADVFAVDAASIDDRASMETIEQWDSLAHINLISAIEEEFNVTFDVDEFELVTTFTELVDILSEKV